MPWRSVNCAALLLCAIVVENSLTDGECRIKLNPSVDIVFKKLFGDERNKNILLSFVNSFIGAEHTLDDLFVMNGYNVMHYTIDQLDLLEIDGMGLDGRRYRINVELRDKGRYDRQGLEDWSTELSDRIEDDIDFMDVYKGFGVHILSTDCVNNTDYHNVFNVTEETVGVQYFTDIELHTLELAKFNETHPGKTFDELADSLNCTLDLWMLFLTKQCLMDTTYFPPQLEARDEDMVFERAMCELEAMHMSAQEMHIYDRHQNFLLMY